MQQLHCFSHRSCQHLNFISIVCLYWKIDRMCFEHLASSFSWLLLKLQLVYLSISKLSSKYHVIRHSDLLTNKINAYLPRRYVLWAVIMHLGQTLSGGHYVAYVRDISVDNKCERENLGDATNIHSTGSFMRTLFSRPRPPPTGCAAKDCCVPRRTGESCWLACDDEVVKQISNEEFEDLLSPEPKMRSAATPYLLFYGKSEVG